MLIFSRLLRLIFLAHLLVGGVCRSNVFYIRYRWRVIKTIYLETEITYFAVALNQMATATRTKSSTVLQLSKLGSKNCSLILTQRYVMASIELERAQSSPPLYLTQRNNNNNNNNNNTPISSKGGPPAANRMRIPSIEGREEPPTAAIKR